VQGSRYKAQGGEVKLFESWLKTQDSPDKPGFSKGVRDKAEIIELSILRFGVESFLDMTLSNTV
jgi:hypothetical protein